jgi:NAD(P)-dependent dehydrogenase (short-subunit alcohol dehydrogenase family)
MDLEGAGAIVTGAAVGTGRAIAERLAAEGARVIVADVDERGERRPSRESAAGGPGSCAPT